MCSPKVCLMNMPLSQPSGSGKHLGKRTGTSGKSSTSMAFHRYSHTALSQGWRACCSFSQGMVLATVFSPEALVLGSERRRAWCMAPQRIHRGKSHDPTGPTSSPSEKPRPNLEAGRRRRPTSYPVLNQVPSSAVLWPLLWVTQPHDLVEEPGAGLDQSQILYLLLSWCRPWKKALCESWFS